MNNETKDKVIHLVAEKTGVSREDIFARGGVRKSSHARFIAAYTLRTMFLVSTTELGKYFGRDHSSIIYYCSQAKKFIETYPEKQAEYQQIKEAVTELIEPKKDLNAELFSLYAKQKHLIRSQEEELTKLRDRVKILESALSIEQKLSIA